MIEFVQMNFRLPKEYADALKKEAEDTDRSITSVFKMILRERYNIDERD